MEEKKPKRKLLLNKETLDDLELEEVSGGALDTSYLCAPPIPLPPNYTIVCPAPPPFPIPKPQPRTIGPFCIG
jgi:hypothetical protein